MPIATAIQKESTAAGYTSTATHVSVHTGTGPGTTGANEATGGTPAYARKPITWVADAVDGVYTSNPIDVDVPAGTYTFLGIWDALTAGNFRDSVDITDVTFAAQGVLRITLTYTQS